MTRLALALLLAGCAPSAMTLELGTGETVFESLSDETELPLVMGPQGGYHVWASLRAQGLSSEMPAMLIDGILIGAEPPPRRMPVRVFMDPIDDGYELVGWPAQLESPECLVGQRILLVATLTDEDGREATDERIVIPLPHPTLPACDQ